jgi:hypothetical protein
MTTHDHRPRRRHSLALGIALTAAVLAGSTTDASAAGRRAPAPVFTLDGAGTWKIRNEIPDVAVTGNGRLSLRHVKQLRVKVAAVVQTDDRTLPAPGECEPADATASAYGVRGVDLALVGRGELCGTVVQPPTNIVAYVFTGTFEVYGNDTRPRRLEGIDGFYEIRLANDGTAHVFAIDT